MGYLWVIAAKPRVARAERVAERAERVASLAALVNARRSPVLVRSLGAAQAHAGECCAMLYA